MFGHPMSKFGYVLAALAVAGAYFRAYSPHDVRNLFDAFVPLFAILGFCTVFLGVIARGFERVEAAILSGEDGRAGRGKPDDHS